MLGIIIFIIIIVAIVKASATGNNAQRRQNRPIQNGPIQNRPMQNRTVPNEHFQPVGGSFEQQKLELRQRAQKRLDAKKQAESRSILNRAKASVEEDFAEAVDTPKTKEQWQQSTEQRQRELARKVEEKMNLAETTQMEDNSDIMKQVEDLMVKGPDTSMIFGRDFLAEGMDMLNRIQA